MPRLREIRREDADPSVLPLYDALFGDRDPVASPGTATGTPGNWWTVFALVPDCFNHAVAGFQFYRSKNRKLKAKLRELGQTRGGVRQRQSVCVFPALQKHARGWLQRRTYCSDPQLADL